MRLREIYRKVAFFIKKTTNFKNQNGNLKRQKKLTSALYSSKSMIQSKIRGKNVQEAKQFDLMVVPKPSAKQFDCRSPSRVP